MTDSPPLTTFPPINGQGAGVPPVTPVDVQAPQSILNQLLAGNATPDVVQATPVVLPRAAPSMTAATAVPPTSTTAASPSPASMTQDEFDAEVARLDDIFHHNPDDGLAHDAGIKLLNAFALARSGNLRINHALWEIHGRSLRALEEKMEIAGIDAGCPPPPAGLINALQDTGSAMSRVHAWRIWSTFCDRQPHISGVPEPLTVAHTAGVAAIADSSKITAWTEVQEHLERAEDAVDMILGHPFAKDDARPNTWFQVTGGKNEFADAIDDLCREAAPSRTLTTWQRLNTMPQGCTPEFFRDLAQGFRVCARALTGDGSEVDSQSDTDDFRNAAGLCLIAGLGLEAVIAIGSAPGMTDYWSCLAELAKDCLNEEHPQLRAKRGEYVKLVADAHKMSGVPLGFLRLDWAAAVQVMVKFNIDPDRWAVGRFLNALATLHVMKYARVRGRPVGNQRCRVMVRYQGQSAMVEPEKGGDGPLSILFGPKAESTRAFRELLQMPADGKKAVTIAGKAAAWALRNTPCSALPRLRVLGEDPMLLADPDGATFAAYGMRAGGWLRAHHGVDGIARFDGVAIDLHPIIEQADLIRYEWPGAGAGEADHTRWKALLPTGAIEPVPFSVSLPRAFPNMVLPADPRVREAYLALLDSLLTVNLLRDELRHGVWREALAKEFPYLGILPATGHQGSGGGGKRGKEFNIGKSVYAQVVIEATRGQRWDSSMSTSAIDGGDVANRSTTEAVRNHGFFTADEFPFVQLATSDDTQANGAFSADGMCRWATGDTNLCPVVRENAPQLPLRYTSIISGKPFPRTRDDVVSRIVFVFLGALQKDDETLRQIMSGTLARNLRLAHLAWLETSSWRERMSSESVAFENWRFPIHAMVAEALHPGASAGVDEAAAWMRAERARIGEEARSDHTETGSAGVLEHLVGQATEEHFADLFNGAKVAKDPRLPQRYIGSWDFYANLAFLVSGGTFQGLSAMQNSAHLELRKLLGTKATAKSTTSAAKRSFDCAAPRCFFERWTVRYVDKDEPESTLENNNSQRLAGLELIDLHPARPVRRRISAVSMISDTLAAT